MNADANARAHDRPTGRAPRGGDVNVNARTIHPADVKDLLLEAAP